MLYASRKERFNGCIFLLTSAAKLEPKNAEVYILTGDAYLENNNDGSNAIKTTKKQLKLTNLL